MPRQMGPPPRTQMPRQMGPPPGPKCLGIWVPVINCTSRHLGPGRGRRGGPSFLMRFIYSILLAPAGFDTKDTFVVTFSTVS